MKILFLTSDHNILSQRLFLEFLENHYDVTLCEANSQQQLREITLQLKPTLIFSPYVSFIIPPDIWQNYRCILLQPGVKGDRGISSLDWAILNEQTTWGVTLYEANGEIGCGDIWATEQFEVMDRTKSATLRHEVTIASVKCMYQLFKHLNNTSFTPEVLNYKNDDVYGHYMPKMQQLIRRINWTIDTAKTIVKKIRAADSHPGVYDNYLFPEGYYLYGAHLEEKLTGAVGEIIAYRDDAICVGTIDQSVWISHVKKEGALKLPATTALKHYLTNVPECPLDPFAIIPYKTYREIEYVENNAVAYLTFSFYNGEMHTKQCENLQNVLQQIRDRTVKVVVLLGGEDFWSTGIHSNLILSSTDSSSEMIRNVEAMHALIKELQALPNKITIAALRGHVTFNGYLLAEAATYVMAKEHLLFQSFPKNLLASISSITHVTIHSTYTQHSKRKDAQTFTAAYAKKLGIVDYVFGETTSQFNRLLPLHIQAITNNALHYKRKYKLNPIHRLATFRLHQENERTSNEKLLTTFLQSKEAFY